MDKKERDRRYLRARSQALRRILFEWYGVVCSMCGEARVKHLEIDHINGGGNKHRELTGHGYGNYLSILKEGYRPDKYRVLCRNCNHGLWQQTKDQYQQDLEDELVERYRPRFPRTGERCEYHD
jgi:hypothetical protein